MDWKLELVQVPVSDVDRAKDFYVEQVGFNARPRPPGQRRAALRAADAAGVGLLDRASGRGSARWRPARVQGLQLVVPDIEAAHAELSGRGVEVGEIQDFPWGSFVFFSDPDGNGWAVQQVQPRNA